jgi:hypothetical protein
LKIKGLSYFLVFFRTAFHGEQSFIRAPKKKNIITWQYVKYRCFFMPVSGKKRGFAYDYVFYDGPDYRT